MTDDQMIAQALKAGKVTRVAPGERAKTEREMYRAARGEQRLIDERNTVVDHMGRVRVRNGLGEWIA